MGPFGPCCPFWKLFGLLVPVGPFWKLFGLLEPVDPFWKLFGLLEPVGLCWLLLVSNYSLFTATTLHSLPLILMHFLIDFALPMSSVL